MSLKLLLIDTAAAAGWISQERQTRLRSKDAAIYRRKKLEQERDDAIAILRMREGPTETVISKLEKINDELKTL